MGSTKAEITFSPQALAVCLPPVGAGNCYRVAFSGGLDSTALLHALRSYPRVRAIHINHGMQADAQAWQTHCETVCADWGIPLDIRKVAPDSGPDGPEAGARKARYAAIADVMQQGDVLLTAQHADDQAETFLLQALRGAGVRGLAAMPTLTDFGHGAVVRPLLRYTRTQLHDYAKAQGLSWVEDPSNADMALARAYLRQKVAPALAAHWPRHAHTLARAAAWCAQASELNAELAELDFQTCRGPVAHCLLLPAVRNLSDVRRSNLLRHWLQQSHLTPPDHRHIEQLQVLINNSRSDAQPLVAWQDTQVRRYREWLFASVALPAVPDDYQANWDMQQPLELPAGCGWLQAQHWPRQTVTVRLRRGGEQFRRPGRKHHSSLKNALQEGAVPPWVRARLPLVYCNDELIAVADYGWRAPKNALANVPQNVQSPARLLWSGAPAGAGLPRVVAAHAFKLA